MNRREKLQRLLDIAPPVEDDVEVPTNPSRFLALEQDDDGNTIEMYFADALDELHPRVANTESRFVARVRVHDLDTDAVLAPVWKIERFATIEESFSYKDGYVALD